MIEVKIREPSSTPRAVAPPAPTGKGKKKASEPPAPIDESSDENDTVFSFLDSLPILCHLFDGDGNFKYAPNLDSDFFMPKSECNTSRVYNVATSDDSSGILLTIFFVSFPDITYSIIYTISLLVYLLLFQKWTSSTCSTYTVPPRLLKLPRA